MIENGKCTCKGCIEQQEALHKQLLHPFYAKVDRFRNEVKREALEKASVKYSEPFNPRKWSIKQLAKHAMSENYDQSNYIYGMYERMIDMQNQIDDLQAELRELKGETE